MAVTIWNIDPSHSAIGFSVRHMVVSKTRGRFTKWSGQIAFDPDRPQDSKVEVAIDPASIDTADAQRDAHLRSPDFFDVEKYPTITFKTTKIIKGEAPNTVKAEGNLTIHGVTKPVTVNVEYTPDTVAGGQTVQGLTATTKINRKDFGLNWNKALESGGVLVGDDVQITIEAELHKKDAPTAAK